MTSDASYVIEDQLRMTQAKNYFAWQYRLVSRELGRRVVEIGCGVGNFTATLLDGRAVMALDIEPQCVERLQARFPETAGLQVLQCDWEAAHWETRTFSSLKAFRPDSIVCLNVLEHIEDDCEALRRMGAILEPGGKIVLLTPAFSLLYGPIDKRLGHYRRYTRASIRKAAQEAGLHVERARYMNLIGFFGWWFNAHLLRKEVQSPRQIRIFDRYLVPVSSRLESWIQPPFGQSLIVTLRKE